MASRKEDAFGPHDLYLGVDVGKSFHWAVAVDGEGEVAADRPLPNRKADVDALLDEAGPGALVVVDQKNNIGALVAERCRARGVDVGYLPGKATREARDMFPGTAKTDRTGAGAVARTAMGMRRVVLPVAEGDDLGASVSLLSSQLDYATRRATMARNRLRAVLPGSDPSFEAVVDPSSPWQLSVLTELGGAAGVSSAGKRRHRSLCGRLGVREPARDALWDAAVASARAGSKTLKNLLISGRNPLVGTKNRFGRHCDECASRGMRRSRALKAVARKESGVTYAIIRNWVPYEEPSSGADAEKSPITV